MTLLFLTMIIKAALLSAMLMVPNTASQMPTLEKDTFERSPKTEYVTEPNNYVGHLYTQLFQCVQMFFNALEAELESITYFKI